MFIVCNILANNLIEEDDDQGRLPLNTAISTTRPQSSTANYGSLSTGKKKKKKMIAKVLHMSLT